MTMNLTKIKFISVSILGTFVLLAGLGLQQARHIPTGYRMDQFMPAHHPLLAWDDQSKALFQLSNTSPQIVLLSLPKSDPGFWYDSAHIGKLGQLSAQIQAMKSVTSVIGLGNVQSAFEQKDSLMVGTLNDLLKQGFDLKNLLNDPLYSPNLISKDGRDTAIFVYPQDGLSQAKQTQLMKNLSRLTEKTLPGATVQIGGAGAVRTQLVDLLSREIMVFILLALVAAMVVLKFMFRGLRVLPQVLFILVVSNSLALGLMSWLHFSFNILSSTLPIIVTICSLGIATHTLVRMAEAADLPKEHKRDFLMNLMRELTVPHLMTALTTSVGFGTLAISDVPMISQYGKIVAGGVAVGAVATLLLIPALYIWFEWPTPRSFLRETPGYGRFLVRYSRRLVYGIAGLVFVFILIGTQLSWSARLFDDLPKGRSARASTELISRKLGGVAPADFTVGGSSAKDPWKQPENLRKLKALAAEWRRNPNVGSVVTLSDFLSVGKNKETLPKSERAVAELEFLYGMSGASPLRQFLSADEKWTRVAVRLPDLPANVNQPIIANIKKDLKSAFPGLQVRVSGLAAIVPNVYNDISGRLMWGFFEALFWIVLLLAFVFRSLSWALIGVVPNLVPPILLLGFLALFAIPIKPGIAIIFSISLGLAFTNTIYVLGRLKKMLADQNRSRTLPVYEMVTYETMPCLVSSLSLFAGFSIFLFSVFPANKLFGLFMLISIMAGLLGDLVWLPAILRQYPWLILDGRQGAWMQHLPSRVQSVLRLFPYVILLGLGVIAFHSLF